MQHAQLLACLKSLSQERRDVDLGTSVPKVHISQLDALTFTTEFVARNRPCIIQGAIDAWPAVRLWDEVYLVAKAGDMPVTVDVTPNGRADAVTPCSLGELRCQPQPPLEEGSASRLDCADCVGGTSQVHRQLQPSLHEGSTSKLGASEFAGDTVLAAASTALSPEGMVDLFVTPHERRMSLAQFFSLLRASRQTEKGKPPEVPYIQHQNSSFSSEYTFLHQDILPGLEWAEAVFGGPPDATNLWIGDERSTTSFHKDHYENLYAVLTGTKVFTLMPPCDVWRMHLRAYPAAQWEPCQPAGSEGEAGVVAATTASGPTAAAPAAPAAAGAGGRATARQANARVVAGVGNGSSDVACDVHMQNGSQSQRPPQRPDCVNHKLCNNTVLRNTNTEAATPGAIEGAAQAVAGLAAAAGASQAGATAVAQGLHSSRMTPVLKRPAEEVVWCAVDPCPGDRQAAARKFPHFFDPNLPAPLVAEVGPGEVLYLPALWYHYVEQRADSPGRDYVLALNFWYDMRFDANWCHYQLVQSLAAGLGLVPQQQ